MTSTATARFDLKAKTKRPKPPPRLVLYGEPGIGKTSFGTSAPGVVLIPTEDGALGVDVQRPPSEGRCQTWDDVLTACRVLLDGEHSFKWAVLDTINGAEQLCAQAVCDRDFGGVWNTRKGQEGYNSFGKGEKATAQELRQLLGLLDQLQQRRGMGVVLLAHVGMHKQANALGADFYKFGADLGKSSWALVCGWADQVGFATREFRTSLREGEQRAKASAIGSERWIVFEGGPGVDAKGRVGYEMPERLLLTWDEYEAALAADRLGALVEQVTTLLAEVPEAARKTVAQRLGGAVEPTKLREIGKPKLVALINWLLAQRERATAGKDAR